jgi:hypothetical protein
LVAAGGDAPEVDKATLAPAESAYLAAGPGGSWLKGCTGTSRAPSRYGSNDSPAGLAGWIVEKWHAWSDCGGDVESRFSKDELLTHLTIYWATQTIASSLRLYFERNEAPQLLPVTRPVAVPTACARFPAEVLDPPREWIARFYNLQRFTDMPSGGHFAAAEEPGLIATDIRDSFFGRQAIA